MRKIVITIICVAFAVVFVVDSKGISTTVFESIYLCLNTIIPSLFAFLTLSTFIMSSGLIKSNTAIFILSMLGGYPVGAKLISDKIKANPSYKKTGENMLMYCFCGSPVFLIAITNLGIYVWLSNMIACFVFAVVMNIKINTKKQKNNQSLNHMVSRSTNHCQLFVDSVTSAGIVLYKICVMVIIFGVVIRMLELIGINNNILYSFIEITNVIKTQANPAVIAALTSMGGVCIMFQVAAICNEKLRLRKFLIARIPIAILSAGICHLITRNLVVPRGEALETIAVHRIEVSSGRSVLASICLLIMTLLLLRKCPSSYK